LTHLCSDKLSHRRSGIQGSGKGNQNQPAEMNSRLSKALTNREVALLAVYLPGGETSPIETEDMAVSRMEHSQSVSSVASVVGSQVSPAKSN
jgi:hypothetical protein